MQKVKTIADLSSIESTKLQVLSVGPIKTEKERTDLKESRSYFLLTVGVDGDILGSEGKAKRNIFQEHNAEGKASWDIVIDAVKPGITLKGQIIDFEVQPYFIPSETGDVIENGVKGRYVSNYPMFVLEREMTPAKMLSLLNNTGRYLVEQQVPTQGTAQVRATIESGQLA